METITVSSQGQISIPKNVREALNLSEGAELTVEVRGHEIVLSTEPAWKKLRGAARGSNLMEAYAEEKKLEREREDSRF